MSNRPDKFRSAPPKPPLTLVGIKAGDYITFATGEQRELLSAHKHLSYSTSRHFFALEVKTPLVKSHLASFDYQENGKPYNQYSALVTHILLALLSP
jgi:hypothetical protein